MISPIVVSLTLSVLLFFFAIYVFVEWIYPSSKSTTASSASSLPSVQQPVAPAAASTTKSCLSFEPSDHHCRKYFEFNCHLNDHNQYSCAWS